jgi:hypothetical protein
VRLQLLHRPLLRLPRLDGGVESGLLLTPDLLMVMIASTSVRCMACVY